MLTRDCPRCHAASAGRSDVSLRSPARASLLAGLGIFTRSCIYIVSMFVRFARQAGRYSFTAMHSTASSLVGLLSAASLAVASPLLKRALDSQALAQKYFGNDAPWYRDRVPYFECSDSEIQDVYYYRWKIFRAHQRDLGERGYISTGIDGPELKYCNVD